MRRTFIVGLAALLLFPLCMPSAHAKPPINVNEIRILAYGDSFTSGYGLEPDEAYTIKLREILNDEFSQERIEVINAGVSGDTASSAVGRLSSVLAEKPDMVILAFGATDALKRVDPDIIYKAMEQILSTLTHNNIYVLLCGFQAPDDVSVEYAARYNAIFPTLAKRYRVAYLPDLLKGVKGVWYNLQYDSFHPSGEGMEEIAKTLAEPLSRMIRNVRDRFYFRRLHQRRGY